MSPFTFRDDAYRATWEPFEITVFAGVAGSVISVLGGKRDNPTRQKLMPPLSKDDAAARELDRLAGQQIADNKIKNLKALQDSLVNSVTRHFELQEFDKLMSDSVTAPDQPHSQTVDQEKVEWVIPATELTSVLQALTAIRTYLASVLGIESDDDSDRLYELLYAHNAYPNVELDDAKQRRLFLASTFAASGFVQESLLEATMGPHDEDHIAQ